LTANNGAVGAGAGAFTCMSAAPTRPAAAIVKAARKSVVLVVNIGALQYVALAFFVLGLTFVIFKQLRLLSFSSNFD
jgi:hypothetical protein